MKILIIGLARSGTTSLMQGLKNSMDNSIFLFETFNKFSPQYIGQEGFNSHLEYLNSFPNSKNLIEKVIIGDPLSNIHNLPLFANSTIEQFSKYIDVSHLTIYFYLEYIKSFNRIILMSRKNLKKSVESWANSQSTGEFFKPYKYNPNLNFTPYITLFSSFNLILEKLSSVTNIPITYYEDLYTGNEEDIQKFLIKNNIQVDNFEKLYEYLHPKNKLRQN
jgi:hypothetical protein